MVGKISDVYKVAIVNAPEIPNFPIMPNAILAGTNDMSPAISTVTHNIIYA